MKNAYFCLLFIFDNFSLITNWSLISLIISYWDTMPIQALQDTMFFIKGISYV